MQKVDRQKARPVKAFVAAAILILSLVLWLIPSHVVELIAEQRPVLLNRYSMAWFSVLFSLTPLLWLISYALWVSQRLTKKEIGFRVGAILLSLLVSMLAVDALGRLIRKPRYREERVDIRQHWPGERVVDVVRHRPPDRLYNVRYVDAPPTARSYPNAPPGHSTVEITLKTDARGFRNLTSLKQYDIVTIGDSFTEGSRVSDDECWPVLVGKATGQSVYNLGISGGRPGSYLTAFRAIGLALKPKVAVFMIYGGNDFKGVRFEKGTVAAQEPLGERVLEGIKASPVVLGLKKAFIEYLGPINADGPVSGIRVISWMPVAVSVEGQATYYAFTPSRLMRLDWTEPDFTRSQEWTSTAKVFKMIKALCQAEGIRLVFAYAPSKPLVIMPLAWHQVPAEGLHAFASFKKRDLARPNALKERLIQTIETQENVLCRFCADEGIEFVSTTEVLRKMARAGHQVYYTYDQHWTSLGHATVAEELSRHFMAPRQDRP
jgi:hypothetical protein